MSNQFREQLPECMHRGEEFIPGTFICRSNRMSLADGSASIEMCLMCPVANIKNDESKPTFQIEWVPSSKPEAVVSQNQEVVHPPEPPKPPPPLPPAQVESPKEDRRSIWEKAKQAVNGAIGVGKAFLGVDATEEDIVKARWTACSGNSAEGGDVPKCDQNHYGQCKHCGCYIAAKIRIANEQCPIGKW